MKLTEEQLKSVAAWFVGGASLDEIQKRLVAEFGVHVTYFDLRMIVAELPQPEEGEETDDDKAAGRRFPQEEEGNEADAQERVPPDDGAQERVPPDDGSQERVPPANVTVTVDALMIPGTMASGDVTFSDGVKGKWYLDQMGRLGLGGDLPPSWSGRRGERGVSSLASRCRAVSGASHGGASRERIVLKAER